MQFLFYLKILTFANNSVEKTSLGVKQGEKLGVKPAQSFYTKRYYFILYTTGEKPRTLLSFLRSTVGL